ncbi:MAG: cytochrome d ubiquinol oxidase subunit II [Bacteroidales bacterium]|nr:cytochrome d ubiquinol oxidase subunit II [Bacteroidales bacterium]
MFENLSYLALQQYWWIIISLLGSVLVFLFFVQGGQTLIYKLGRTETERTMIVNALGRKWEFTFTTLVTFGGAFFASFPLFYATSFGGAYWVWMLILIAFVIQAIAYEFRTKPRNFLGQRTFETFLYLNGAVGTILVGTAVATFFTGSSFFVNDMNFSEWKTPFHGLELAFGFSKYTAFINLSLGLAVFFLSRVLGNLYLVNTIDDAILHKRAFHLLFRDALPFLLFFLFFLVNILVRKGFAYNPDTGEVFMEPFKYLHNLIQMPVVLILLLAGVALVVAGLYKTWKSYDTFHTKAIWFVGPGAILTVFALFLTAGFNHTAFYPSIYDLQSSLTIENASSSKYTLAAMSYVSLLVPFVFAYIWYAWKAINKKKIDKKEMEEETHKY